MNISDSELAALGTTFGVVGQASTAALQSAMLNVLWSVVVLERTGDAAKDPYRTITCFTTKARAVAFATGLRFTEGREAVLLYNGTAFDSVVQVTDTSLVDMYCTRAGVAHPAPSATEIAAVATEAVKPKPSTLTKKPSSSR